MLASSDDEASAAQLSGLINELAGLVGEGAPATCASFPTAMPYA